MLNKLQEELKIALKSGDKAASIGFRNIIGKLNAARIDKGESLSDEESIIILKSTAKQLRESIEQYNKGGREDLVEKELFELSLLDKYLPEQLSEDKIREVINKTIQFAGAESMQDMGQVMGTTMKKLAGAADGKMVREIVQEELSS